LEDKEKDKCHCDDDCDCGDECDCNHDEKEHKHDHKHKHEKDEKLEELVADLNDKLLRTQAEMINMNRRLQEEYSRLMKYSNEDMVKSLLPVVDNFGRAILMDDNNLQDEVSKFLTGFKMIYTNFEEILKQYEVNEIEVLDKPFDPKFHDAIATDKVDGKPSGVVTAVLQKGYMLKDKVIRPAMVKVNE
jgi:molecular chaperone GrpE